MKKKIVFYGNCQFGGLSFAFENHPLLTPHFEVLKASDYNLPYQQYSAIANYQLTNENHTQRDFERIFEDADILVFQSLGPAPHRPDHVLTANVVPKFEGECVGIPSFWYSGYFHFPYEFPMLDIFYWLHNQGYDDSQALNHLQHESLPFAQQLHKYYHDESLQGVRQRTSIDPFEMIDIENWIDDNHSKKLITYNHSHPSIHFFEYAIGQILLKLQYDIGDVTLSNATLQHSGPDGFFIPTAFKWFKDLFPNMEPLTSDIINMYDAWHPYKSNEIEKFVSEGMDTVRSNVQFKQHKSFAAKENFTEVKQILGLIND